MEMVLKCLEEEELRLGEAGEKRTAGSQPEAGAAAQNGITVRWLVSDGGKMRQSRNQNDSQNSWLWQLGG